MAEYYFVRSNGHLFRLTKNGFRIWVMDSANRLSCGDSPAKIKHYGADLGRIYSLTSDLTDQDIDFFKINKLYSCLDSKTDS